MLQHPRQVAILGSGVMGSAIAAHFANAGVRALVLDIAPRELNEAERKAGLALDDPRVRGRLAADSVKALARAKPPALFAAWRMALIETGNLEDDLPKIAGADWVVEAVREELGTKQQVLAAAARHLRKDALLSSNTSGLSLAAMSDVLPADVRPRFLGTHFFNPPRYMKLLELIPTADTAPGVIDAVERYCRVRLGKGVVRAKDTPNFISNRIGVHALLVTLRAMDRLKLSIEEVDALTGPALGRPKTATFRLADLVGLDTLLHVARNTHAACPDDEAREVFVPPPLVERMVAKGLLGRKTGAGFYKKVKDQILVLDPATLEYRPQVEPELPELAALRGAGSAAERIRRLVGAEGRGAEAAWAILAPTLSYAAMRLGEIADDAARIDEALRLGFNWELGPFEVWDALGFRATTERLKQDGHALPDWVEALLASGAPSIYAEEGGVRTSPGATPGTRRPVAADPERIAFDVLRRAGREVRRNDSASLVDLGDGVLGLEFHSKSNSIDAGTLELLFAAADEAERSWQALVVANDGEHFCAGANLKMLVGHAQAGDFKAIGAIVEEFQRAATRLERCAVPVVVAPHGMAVGGGCEIVLAGQATHAAAESYIGLVEVGAGLVPAGGGCMRLYRRLVAQSGEGADPFAALRRAFETIGTGKVSSSAEEARDLGFLGPQDGWAMNGDHRVAAAKALALAMARAGHTAATGEATLPVLGRSGFAAIESALVNMREARHISDHDRKIGRELARILAGGDVAGPLRVAESWILELEREAFLRLCGEPKTQQRIVALLTTGKPLRN